MSKREVKLPARQRAIGRKCFHPSGTFVAFPIEDVETSIPARFEKIVRLYSNNLAIKMGDQSLTYDELNRYANRIAHAILETRGPGSEPIALVFENGVDLIAAILGVLKAGKFYVVLDPLLPPERFQFFLNDSGSRLLVTDRYRQDAVSRLTDKNQGLLAVEIADKTHSSDPLDVHVLPHELHCVRYTSGSTGTPKGVVELHENVLLSVRWMTEEIRVRQYDRFSLLHSLSFASAYVNLWLALLNGAALMGFNIKREKIEKLASWLKDEDITILHSPPSLFRQLAESLPMGPSYPNLRLIRLSGAPINRRDFELYKSRFARGTSLRVGMGSTEARGICAAILDHHFPFPADGSPIGYPPPGKKIVLLDEANSEVALGQVGEIAVKGKNLNPRYWGDLAQQQGKFLLSPEGEEEKIYLTGDLGRMLPDGFVIHLGRKDLTVKIRGYRVDFSEVERALLEHPSIKDAGVRSWDREDGEKYLAGYIVLRPESQLNVSEIRRFLSTKLPDYMIPPAIQFIEALPLTNGKLDRQALPKPDALRPALKEAYVAPRNETERKLAWIWSEVLKFGDIGIHDNFFDLGGHSLAVARILSRVLACFQVDLSPGLLYESPTVAGLALDVESALRQERSHPDVPLIPISQRNKLPASFGQRALWFHQQLEPGSRAYNLQSAYRLSGELDAQLLERAINQIIARHEILRTVFETVDGAPIQKIVPTMPIDLKVIDLIAVESEASQDLEVRRFVGVLAERPFDLTRGPLLRAALLKLASHDHVFLLVIHHVVFDGWSTGVFFRELSQIYNSLKNGKSGLLPELAIQYADFARWQSERLIDATLQSSLSFWKTQLDHLPTLTLPVTGAQNISEPVGSGREEFEVAGKLLDRLRGLAHRSGTTLFMVLLAAWKITLCRYTDQTDIAIGTPVAGRSHPAVEDLIGYFLNLVVLRSDLSGDPTVRELLERIRRVCVDAFSHQEVPFEKLVEELRPTRQVAANPLVQATFALQNTPKNPLHLAGITARDLDISAGVARPFDLHLYMIEEESRLQSYASYNKNLFAIDTIKRLIRHFTNILEAIALDQDQRISKLPMLSAPERRQLLIEWNDTHADYPREKCIHELFEAQVERMPEAAAVVCENQKLSYGDLNARANQLAHDLRRRGVGPETVVAVFMERSLEMVVALLGVLKAGGAYLPIDPDLPHERIHFMLQDSQAAFVLTQARFDEQLASFAGKRIFMDRDGPEIEREERGNLDERQNPSNLAYVIYTSGSTGTPKGVMIEHRSVANLLASMAREPGLTQSDVLLAVTTLSFDIAGLEIYLPLAVGARVVIASREVAANAVKLTELLSRSGATVMQATPATWRMLLAAGWEGNPKLKVLCGGEALSERLAKELAGRCSSLWNLYGPTETTIWSAVRRITEPIERVPIGRPIANTQIYILDPFLNPVPVGVVGELHIGGAGLARGYLNRPELTAEKFIANPFSSEPGARLYKTGDLARHLPDGDIELLGRIDDQIKMRGYRIELGEIEATLRQQTGVEDAIVVAREFNGGDPRLIAYWVEAEGHVLNIDEAKRFLRRKLPEYMVPTVWVKLASLPRSPNGKIDRAALPAPAAAQPEPEALKAPRTPVEKLLAEVWREVLKVSQLGIDDNFFELGGHSLLATRVVARLSHVLNAEIPVRFLFEAPTIGELALRIAAQQETRSRDEGVKTQSQSVQRDELDGVLAELETMSEDDAKGLLADQKIAMLNEVGAMAEEKTQGLLRSQSSRGQKR